MFKKLFFIIAFLLFLGFLFRSHLLPENGSKLRVVFFDVGQGDSILITTPAGQTILIDGGEGDVVLSKLGKYLPFYQKKINYMILTHPHADHLDGLVPVLKKYQVEQILYSGAAHATDTFLEWLELIKDKNIPLKIIDRQQTLTLDNGVQLEFLYPNRVIMTPSQAEEESLTSSSSPRGVERTPRNDNYQEESPYQKNNNLNNTSIVFKLIYGQTSFLFMGDAETPVEQILLSPPARGGDTEGVGEKNRGWLKSDVLKVAHHGSHSSTSEEFLRAVQPKIAVISVGADNDFGHPHARTLRRLERFGAKILRTDEARDIEMESDEKRVRP